MVELVNRSLLQTLRTYVEQDYEWEQYLPLVLYAYHTAVHTSLESHYLYSCSAQSAGVMIYHLLLHLTQTCAKAIFKLAELQDFFVEASTVQAGAAQKTAFNSAIVQRIDTKA